jgi:uncharacterized protein (TIGR02246 family)
MERPMLRSKNILPITVLALLIWLTCGHLATARPATAKDSNHEPDTLAIDRINNDMIRAFTKRDAQAMADHWTDRGEFIRNDDEPIRGRDEIRKGYVEFFKTLDGNPKLEIEPASLRFLSGDTAVSEETLRLRNDEGEVVASSWQHSVLVREDGQWKLAVVRASDRGIGLDSSLKELDWLIGTWQAASKDQVVTITYQWEKNGAFIRGNYEVTDGTNVIDSGTQFIGKDNAQGVIRCWIFQSDGGSGGGVWTRDGKRWSVELHGINADGRQLSATTLLIHVDPNTFTWQAVDQTLDGVSLTDTEPIKVTKQTSAK